MNKVFPGPGKQPRRPANFTPWRYQCSTEELRARDSDDMMRRAAAAWDEIRRANQNGKWKPTDDSLTSHQAPQWFLDAKFGMFLDWGPWAVAGWASSAPKAMYPDWYEYFCRYKPETAPYHDKVWGKDFAPDNFLPLLTGENFSAEYYAQLAADAGMKYVVPFNKHHGGYCLWDSSFTHRTSLKIGARRDFTTEIMNACRESALKCGAYFSLFEWFYPLITDAGIMLQTDKAGKIVALDETNAGMIAGKIPVRDFVSDYLAPQLKELIDRYDPDLLWYDGDWLDPMTYFRTHELNAYYYNRAEGRKDVAINDRSGRTRAEHGVPRVIADFITSEFHSFDGSAGFPWEECRSISQSYGYNWEDDDANVMPSQGLIRMLVDIVSRGGNLLLIVSPTGDGALPPLQERRLRDAGQWLKTNGEAIYGTRPLPLKEPPAWGRLTQKPGKVFLHIFDWPKDRQLRAPIRNRIQAAYPLANRNQSLALTPDTNGACIQLPPTPPDPTVTVIALDIEGTLEARE